MGQPDFVDDVPFDPGPRPELAWLPVSHLSVDLSYQRTLESMRSKQNIRHIAEHFKWSHFGVVIVAQRGDGWVIIDGQHRVEGAKLRKIPMVPCVVVPAVGVEEQAKIFLATNQRRVSVNPYALYWARIAAGEPKALTTKAFCDASGIAVPKYPIPVSRMLPGQTMALGFLEAAANGDNPKLALEAVTAAVRGSVTKPGGLSIIVLRAALLALAEDRTGGGRIEAYLARNDPETIRNRFPGNGSIVDLARSMLRQAQGNFVSDDLRQRAMGGR